jgi:hypothetical protein
MLTAKFLRAHTMPSNPNGYAWFARLLYEFWGFCVWGDNDLVNPGTSAFPPVSGTQMPANFYTAPLLQSGSDGFTTVGEPFFNTVGQNTFSASWVGKWLTLWQSGSTCTDDSIYQITQWINSSSVRLNVFQGGTPYTGSLHPSLTTRTNINYRLIDYAEAASAGISDQDYMVLQFADAPLVNPGQALSQAKLRFSTTYNGGNPIVAITMSPSGSWGLNSGSYDFTDPTSELDHSSNSGGWGNIRGTCSGYISFFGAGDFIIVHMATSANYHSDGFHIEIPQRLYPQGDDPNPIAMMEWGEDTPVADDSTQQYCGGFYMHNPPDGTTMQYYGMMRGYDGSDQSSALGASNGRYNGRYFNTFTNQFLFTDCTLAQANTPGQYQMARVRIRRARFIAPIIPSYQRVGNNGEWLHIVNGIMWPWDNTLLPYNLFLGGT